MDLKKITGIKTHKWEGFYHHILGVITYANAKLKGYKFVCSEY